MIEVSTGDPTDVAAVAAASLPDSWPAVLFEQELRLAEMRLRVAGEGAGRIGHPVARRIADFATVGRRTRYYPERVKTPCW